jgi:hypothetical protein
VAEGTTFTIKLDADPSQALLKISGFVQQFQGIIGALVPAAGGLLSVGGFAALGEQFLELAERMGKLSEKTGLSVEQVAGLAYAAERSNVSVESLTRGLKTFSEWLIKSGQGGKDLRTALLEQAALFEKIPNGAAKATRAVELFGRAGLDFIPLLNLGPGELSKKFERGEILSGVTAGASVTAEQFHTAVKDLKLASESLAGTMLLNLLPALTKVIGKMIDGIVAFRDWSKQSEAFRVGIEAAGIALASFAAIKLAPVVIAGAAQFLPMILGLTNLVGPIRSLRDFAAALEFIPAAIAAMYGPIAALTVGVASLTAVVLAGVEAWKMFRSFAIEAQSAKNLAQQNEALAQSLRTEIALRKENGQLTAEQAQRLSKRVDVAMQYPELADRLLVPMAREMTKSNVPEARGKEWTPEELKIANQMLEVERQRAQLEIGKNALPTMLAAREQYMRRNIGLEETLGEIANGRLDRETTLRLNLNQLETEEAKIMQERVNAGEALEQGAITQKEFADIDLKTRKELLTVDKERFALFEKERHERLSEIKSDFRMTDAQKFSAEAPLLTPEERAKRGPDPRSVSQNMMADFAALGNRMGTVAQNIARTVVAPFEGLYSGLHRGIEGLITGTMRWGTALRTISTSIFKSVANAFAQMVSGMITNMVMFIAKWIWQHTVMLLIHTLTETGMTSVTRINSAERGAANVKEGLQTLWKAATKAADAVADVPYVGPILAVAAFAAIMAMGLAAMAFAEGGRPPVGQVALVGERGPELFVPDRPGMIVPNHAMDGFLASRGGSSGGGGNGPGGGGEIHQHFAVLTTESQLPNWTRQSHGEQWVIDTVRRNAHRIR